MKPKIMMNEGEGGGGLPIEPGRRVCAPEGTGPYRIRLRNFRVAARLRRAATLTITTWAAAVE